MGRKRLDLCSSRQGMRHFFRAVSLSLFALTLGSNVLFASDGLPEASAQQQQTVVITGTVRDMLTNTPIAGVNVVDVEFGTGVITHGDGTFTLNARRREKINLLFSFVGMRPLEIVWTGQSSMNVLMQEEAENIGEVIVTGFFERKAESFTGSAATYSQEQLRSVGAQNLLESLKTLDPSVTITENNLFGSDPNQLPDLDIRGKTSIYDPRNSYSTDPNQPLYILDGFETTAREVVNLNMNRIASLTILKDAASTAIYGSRAANGVIVIETVKPQAGKLRVDYGGTFSVDVPDLSDYNLMNAEEKLLFEALSGVYNSNDAYTDYDMKELYNRRLRRVMSGVDTYWLKEPVRTGFSNKHNLFFSGGDQTVMYGFGVNYANTNGAMKKSGNEVLGLNLSLQYRTNQFRFENKFSLEHYNQWKPGVSFEEFANTNPYYEKIDGSNQPKYLEEYKAYASGGGLVNTFRSSNPLYNNNLRHIDEMQYLNFKDNFYAEWRPVDGLKILARFSVEARRQKSEFFKSPFHTDFDSTIATERGEYTKGTNDATILSGDISAVYYKLFAEKHQLHLVLTGEVRSHKGVIDSYTATGFTDDMIPYPSFAGQYPTATTPEYNQIDNRVANIFLNGGYVYDQRYAFDFTIRRDGSSNFGRQNLFTTTWSTGFAWNIHHENFGRKNFDMFRLRFTVGNPGNNNTKYFTETTYQYYTKSNVFGSALYVNQYGSSGLDWEKTVQYTLGLDFVSFNRRFSLNVDAYKKVADPLIVNLDLPASTGREDLKANLGRNTINGIDFNAKFNIINRGKERILWGIGVTGSHKTAKYSKMGDMSKLNDYMRDELESARRFADGGSQYDIWAVPSAGIDPSTGNEIYIKKDGTYTFTFDKSDEAIVGNTEPTLNGVISTTFRYKGWNAAIYLRYMFGGDERNTELKNRIEGLTKSDVLGDNQDKRALYDRWISTGDIAKYKRITDVSGKDSYTTSRFVQKRDWLEGEAISVGYDFEGLPWMKKAGISYLSVRAVFNDLFHWSTIRQERGTEYPFARTGSLSINISF